MSLIYVLHDPTERSKKVYVGKTNDPSGRYRDHLKPVAIKDSSFKSNWIKSLLKRQVKPEMIIIDEVPNELWKEAEQFYVSYFKSIGMELVNGTDGGDGGLSEEAKRKISAAKKGVPKTEEHRKKLAEANRGKKMSLEQKEKISKTMSGRPAHNKGKKHKKETLEKISLANQGSKNHFYGKKHSPEALAKISYASSARQDSEETKKRKSQSIKQWWDKRKSQKVEEI